MDDLTTSIARERPEGYGPLLKVGRAPQRPLRQQIFEHVRANGRAARADITRALDISAGSATTLTADLIAAGLLEEVDDETRDKGRGRPRVALEVVAKAAFVVGVKLAFKAHTAVLVDLKGDVVGKLEQVSSADQRTTDELASEAIALINRLLDVNGRSLSDIACVGVGLPGIVDFNSEIVVWSSLLKEERQDLNGLLADQLEVPIVIENDANMLSLAELWFGKGRDKSDFAVVTVESGVGMGLVLGNELYRGSHGMGLELGHTKVQLDGALCRCGQRGCLEAYISDYALTREAAVALGDEFDASAGDETILDLLLNKARDGHVPSQTIFQRAGRYLSAGLSNVMQLFDPELIILSGGQMKHENLYAADVLEDMQKMTLNGGRKPCKVEIHAWGDWVWARGASALALSAYTDSLFGGEIINWRG